MARLTLRKATAALLGLLLGIDWCTSTTAIADDTPGATTTALTLQSLLHLPPWIAVNLDVTAEPMGGVNPTNNPAGGASWMQQVAVSAELSRGLVTPADQWNEWDHWSLGLQLTSYNGNPNLNAALGTQFPLQTTAEAVGLWLTEASLKRSNRSGNLLVKGGLLPLTPSFIENGNLDGYIHSALNNTLNLMIPGLPITPFVAPGAEVHWKNSSSSELRFGSYWLGPQTAIASMFGVNPVQPKMQGSLQIVQWNLSDLPGSAAMTQPIASKTGPIARQLPAPLLQLGAYTTTASSSLLPAATNIGAYGTLNLPLTLPIGLDNRVWVGISNGFNANANPFPLFVAGGWQSQGVVPGRPLDVLSLGFGRTSFSPQLATGSFEAVLELNYAISINAQLTLQPVIQWIPNAGGGNSGANAYAGGIQLSLSL